MAKAVMMEKTGGPEVLRWVDFDPGQPKAGEVLLRHEAVGLNFIDVYHRTGLYPLPQLHRAFGDITADRRGNPGALPLQISAAQLRLGT